MERENDEKSGGVKNFALGMALYSSASILGPIIFFGVIGYFLDKAYNGKHLILLVSVFIAFIISNILIFRKTFAVMAELKKFHGNGKNGYDDDSDDWR
ncbi:MAG: AtpZ/AtpI family protein [Patescibacteria group bacterium]|nr:AtpZ/AtpI family protein [Patescibacteria group bacterium]